MATRLSPGPWHVEKQELVNFVENVVLSGLQHTIDESNVAETREHLRPIKDNISTLFETLMEIIDDKMQLEVDEMDAFGESAPDFVDYAYIFRCMQGLLVLTNYAGDHFEKASSKRDAFFVSSKGGHKSGKVRRANRNWFSYTVSLTADIIAGGNTTSRAAIIREIFRKWDHPKKVSCPSQDTLERNFDEISKHASRPLTSRQAPKA